VSTPDLGCTGGNNVSTPAPTPILSVRVRPPLVDASNETGLEVNADKTKHMIMS